ncbi:hypothetical protein KEK_08057 [Mycolicibacterium thermoresistibile ATCC 19527]|uniref:Uncharacterized protein n=2 Tax=Mycolicibacterium thermoresistibile TaxID=1797 RepID=G7CF40_MYCT3|nr:hypothetical protein KEK_08057 [Mycolicibacterium thermoresistibile ATCC 19527]
MARRSPWINPKAQLLVRLLAERYGLTLTEDAARETISDQVDHVAAMMRIGRQAAKRYVTDDAITRMADRIAAAVHEAETTPEPSQPRPQLRIVK